MSTMKMNDNIDFKHVVNEIQNLYCVICTTVTVEETWEKHVRSSSHMKAAKRFDLLFEKSDDKVHCKFCNCEVSWTNVKQHEKSHFLVPWDSAEENYNKYEIFFENTILQWKNLFGCCICELSFTEWSLALVHVTDSKHQSLKAKNSEKFDSALIKSANDLSFELLVKEGIFAFDESELECKICKLKSIPISGVRRHLEGLIHVCKKSKFVLEEPANITNEENKEFCISTTTGENEIYNSASNNPRNVNEVNNLRHNVPPENYVVQDARKLSTAAQGRIPESPKKEAQSERKTLMSNSGSERDKQVCHSFDSSLPKYGTIDENKNISVASESVKPLLQSSEASNSQSKHYKHVVEQISDRKFGYQEMQKCHELFQKIRGCDNIVILDTGSYYCRLCRLEIIKPEDVHFHVKSANHLSSLSSSGPEIEENNSKRLENVTEEDFENFYTIKVGETHVVCVICDVSLPSASVNVQKHNEGKAHMRSLNKHGCENISQIGDDTFYCSSCDCTLQGRLEVYLHVKEEKHTTALTRPPAPKAQTSSSLRKPNPNGLRQRVTLLTKLSSPLRRPNSIKHKEDIVQVEKLQCALPEPNSIEQKAEITPVKKMLSSLRKPNSIKPREEITPEKKISSSLRRPNSIESKEDIAPIKIPVRKPTSANSSEGISASQKLLSSLRKPYFVKSRKEGAEDQKLHGSLRELNASESKKETTEPDKLLLEPPQTYADHCFLENNSINNNTTIADNSDTFQEYFEYLSIIDETTVFCEICRCPLSRSERNLVAHVMGKPHSVSLRSYGCNYIEKRNDLSYFCKCCNVPIIHLTDVYRHISSPRHLYFVKGEEKVKSQTPSKLNMEQRIIQDKKKPMLVPKIYEQTTSFADTANANCLDNIIDNLSIDLLANDIVNLGNYDYFCNRCHCKISGMINVHAHATGKKHQKH